MNEWPRTEVRRRIVDLLQHAAGLAHVTVTHSHPPEGLRGEHIWLGSPEGELSWPVSQAPGVRCFDDEWTQPLWLRVESDGDRDGSECDRRIGELAVEVMRALSTDLRLGNDAHVTVATIGNANGPGTMRTETGHDSYVELTVSVTARMQLDI